MKNNKKQSNPMLYDEIKYEIIKTNTKNQCRLIYLINS